MKSNRKGMKSLIIIALIFFLLTNLFAKDPVKKKPVSWSDYQGYMNWHDAKAKCAGSKMRLPTREELDLEYRDKGTESWKKDGNWYWTSEEYSEASARYYDVDIGFPDFTDKTDLLHVRCVR